MNYQLEFHEEVEVDYLEAYSWYETARKGLGEYFLEMVRAKLDQIVENPEIFSQKTKSGYREAVLDIFPYMIVYKIYKRKKVIFINTIIHKKRHPRKKYRK